MLKGGARRDLSRQMDAVSRTQEKSKMASGVLHETAAEMEDMDAGAESSLQPNTLQGSAAVSTHSGPVPSPASTESLDAG